MFVCVSETYKIIIKNLNTKFEIICRLFPFNIYIYIYIYIYIEREIEREMENDFQKSEEKGSKKRERDMYKEEEK